MPFLKSEHSASDSEKWTPKQLVSIILNSLTVNIYSMFMCEWDVNIKKDIKTNNFVSLSVVLSSQEKYTITPDDDLYFVN